MIVLQTPSFIALGADEQTPKKVSQFIVFYHTPTKGQIQVWLRGVNLITEAAEGIEATYEEVCNCLHTNYPEGYFTVDGLAKMHEEMLRKLESLNKDLTFITII